MVPAYHPVVMSFKQLLGLFLCWALISWLAVPAVAQVPSPVEDRSDLPLAQGTKLPLPAGQWQVLATFETRLGDVSWRTTALRNPDPAASVPLLLVREAAVKQRWTSIACQHDADNTFFVDWHDTRTNNRLSKCSRLRVVGANLAAFRSQAAERPGWSRALALLPVGSIPESEDVLLAETTVLDLQGGGLRVEALLRTAVVGASSGSLFVRELTGTQEAPFPTLSQWLTQVTNASANTLLISPAARPQAIDAMLGYNPGTRLGERGTNQPLRDASLPDAVGRREWQLPVRYAAGELIYISKGTGAMGAAALLLRRDYDLIAPSAGDLVYAGRVDTWPSVLVMQHEPGLYSVFTSSLLLSLATGVQPGTRLRLGQVMVGGTGSVLRSPSLWQQLTWHLVASADDLAPALAKEGPEAASAVRKLLQAPQIDTQLVLGLGALHLELDSALPMDGVAFRVNSENWPSADSVFTGLLLPKGRHTVEITSGRLFKSTERRDVDIQPAGTSVHFTDNRGRDLGLVFTPNDLDTTQQARELLASRLQRQTDMTSMAVATPPTQATATVADATSTLAPAPPLTVVTAAPAALPPVLPAAPATPDVQTQPELERLRAQLAQAQHSTAASAAAMSAFQPLPPNPRRKALVIGNNAYEHVARLDNAQTDALAMADALQAIGFNVMVGRDLSERRMKEMLRNFRQTVQGGDEVVVYFAGHGVQLANTNYLLPVDIRGQNEEEVKDESIPLQRVLDDMQERRAGFLLAIIDACRDNPFRTASRAARSRGLAPTSAATGQMIIFSAGAGQQALDKLGNNDTERNGLFTRLLLREIKKPGQPIDRIVRSVRTEVARLAKTVGHEQTPAVYDQTLGDFYFIPMVANSR